MAAFPRHAFPLTLTLLVVCFTAICSARPLTLPQLVLQPESLRGNIQVDNLALRAAAFVIQNLPGSSGSDSSDVASEASESTAAADAATTAAAHPSENDGPEFDDSGATVMVAPELQVKMLKKVAPIIARVLGAGALPEPAAAAEVGQDGSEGVVGGDDAEEQDGSELLSTVSPKLQAKLLRQALFNMGGHSLSATSDSSV